MDKFKSVILFAGFGCFIFSVLLSGLYPFLITDAKVERATIEELASHVLPDFKSMSDSWPLAFDQSFARSDEVYTEAALVAIKNEKIEALPKELSPPARAEALKKIGDEIDALRTTSDELWPKVFAEALELGRNRYVGDACWHCHSQFVRPVANEEQRYGPVNTTEQDNNDLQRPMMWGTRRVGPDLTYEGGKRSNDWHAAHLYDPQSTTPGSVMPRFPFYSREGFRVVRKIAPKKARAGYLDPNTGIIVRREIFGSKADAESAMGEIVEEEIARKGLKRENSGDAEAITNLEESYWVEEAVGPNQKGLSLIAYLQWLGTWRPEDTREINDE